MHSRQRDLRPARALPVLAILALCASTLAPAPARAASNVDVGKRLFMGHCAVCHKRDASGGIKLGDTESADLQSPGLEKMYHNDDTLMRRAIMDGKDEEGGNLDTIMPRWGHVANRLTVAQVNDIIAFLKTQKTKN